MPIETVLAKAGLEPTQVKRPLEEQIAELLPAITESDLKLILEVTKRLARG